MTNYFIASAMLLWNASVWMCYDELESKATNLLGYSPSKIDSRVHSSVSSMVGLEVSQIMIEANK